MMDNQIEQQKQNLNQNTEQGLDSSKYKIKIEVGDPVNISSTDQANSGDYQNKEKVIEQPQKSKRPRKTIEQEIAELDAKRERLIEKKRRQEVHEKIIFGGNIIKMLREMKIDSDKSYDIFYNKIIESTKKIQNKDKEIILKIISRINEIKIH